MSTVNQDWISKSTDIIKALGLTPTANRIQFFYAWMSGENTKAKNNPLATTWDMKRVDPGQTNFNYNGGFPVKNYTNWRVGLQATVNTLKNGYYPEIMRFLSQDLSLANPTPTLVRNLQTWGTGQLPINIFRSWSAEFKKKIGPGSGNRCNCCGRACDCVPVPEKP